MLLDRLARHGVPLPGLPAGGRRRATPPPLGAALACAFFLAYVLLDWLTFVHPMRGGLNITPWNPEAALAVALLVRRPRAWWLALLAVACGELLVRPDVYPWPVSLAEACAMTAGYSATAAVIARFCASDSVAVSRAQLAAFIAAAVGGALAASLLHVAVLAALQVAAPDLLISAVHRGWVGDMAGMLVTLPAFHVLASRAGRSRSAAMLRTTAWWLAAALACAATWAVFARPEDEQFKFFYMLFLPVIWASARFGLTGAVWSSVMVQALLILAVQSAAPYRPLTVFELQVLMAVLCASGLLLGNTVDEREEAERKLRATLQRAAAGDMAAALAHELNQPLAALASYARASQLMARRLGEPQDPQAGPLVDVSSKLVDEAGRASDIVRRLRDFFRERSTRLEPTELWPLLDAATRAQAFRAQALDLRLDWSCDPDVPALWLDRVQVEVVLRNLVANAIEAAAAVDPDGGERRVTVRARLDGDAVVVSVFDSGAGLAVDELGSVFDSRPSAKPGGMGVGLGISRLIVEAHGGRMWAEPGPGGRFYFSLPAKRAEAA